MMVDTQQGDVLLYQTDNDGDIIVEGGLVLMASGLETSAYLSLFGGQEQDDGRDENSQNWWGNIGEEPDKQYRSETQYLLRSLPAVPANLRALEDAAGRDLAWMVSTGAATSVVVEASMPALNRVTIVVAINGDTTLEFVENWRAEL